jgi:hypothetical protein
MKMQGFKPSTLMGKLKQHLPPGVSPDKDLFLAIFFIPLSPSMREAVGAGNHKTTAAVVKAADALWDAQEGHDPTVAAAMNQRSRSPAPANEKKSNKRSGNARSKSLPPSRPNFYSFTTLAMACVSFTTTTGMPKRPSGVFHPVLGRKTKSRRTFIGLAATSTHAIATAMLFPANARLIFRTGGLTRDRYLVDTGATLSMVPCNSKTTPSGPLLKEADGQPIPS